jgi:hypothetical protein
MLPKRWRRLPMPSSHIGGQAQVSDIDATNIYHGAWANFSLLHGQSQDVAGEV